MAGMATLLKYMYNVAYDLVADMWDEITSESAFVLNPVFLQYLLEEYP